jgi:hypothetical protein
MLCDMYVSGVTQPCHSTSLRVSIINSDQKRFPKCHSPPSAADGHSPSSHRQGRLRPDAEIGSVPLVGTRRTSRRSSKQSIGEDEDLAIINAHGLSSLVFICLVLLVFLTEYWVGSKRSSIPTDKHRPTYKHHHHCTSSPPHRQTSPFASSHSHFGALNLNSLAA